MDTKVKEWDESYSRGENFVWYPENDMVRFISKFFVKRTGISELTYSDKYEKRGKLRGLDFGCGIGRGVFLMDDFGIDAHGVDISSYAIEYARDIADNRDRSELKQAFQLIDGTSDLPYEDNFFDMIVSHGVFDSMPFEIAKLNMVKLSKLLRSGGYFYLDLISDDSQHPEGFNGEEVVNTQHEENTIQSYFTMDKLRLMVEGTGFDLEEVTKKRSINMLNNTYHSRLYVILKMNK